MTPKQKLFCEEFVKCRNQKDAYHIAYPDAGEATCRCNSTALMKKPEIIAYIDELNEQIKAENIADLQECLALLTEIMRDETTNKADRLKATDLRLKTLAAYTEKKQIEANVATEIFIDVIEEGEDE